MVKTSLTCVLNKLNTTKAELAKLLNMRRAWFSDFDNGKMNRVHLDVIQKIINYAASKDIELSITDFFTDES